MGRGEHGCGLIVSEGLSRVAIWHGSDVMRLV
jgi:hypothetical protein